MQLETKICSENKTSDDLTVWMITSKEFSFRCLTLKCFELFQQLLFYFFAGLSSPVETKTDDDEYPQDKSEDYEVPEDYDDKVDKSSTTTSLAESHYETQDYTEKAEAGRTVVLRCLGADFVAGTIFMWYNGSQIIVQNEPRKGLDKRISFSKTDGSLTIRELSTFDDETFICHAFPGNLRYKTLIHLHISGPPRGITIGHNVKSQHDITGNTLVYRSGHKDLKFKCSVAKARPEAKINWIHNGNTILESQGKDHDLKIEDEGHLIIKNLHARHSGEYQCEASNEFGNLKASFKLDVECKFEWKFWWRQFLRSTIRSLITSSL